MKKVMFVGQAMPRLKRDPHDWPTLNNWLYSIGLSDTLIRSNFFYSALVDYFPGAKNGSHLVPTEEEIVKERKRLQKQLTDFNPEVVVTVGKLSIEKCLGINIKLLSDVIGKSYQVDPYMLFGKKVLVIPLPHPSGASTWRHNVSNKILLSQSLQLLSKVIS